VAQLFSLGSSVNKSTTQNNPGHKMIRQIKDSINHLLSPFGYRIINNNLLPTMDSAIESVKKREHKFHTVIDIGASDGRWSKQMMKFFPDCKYILIEAQPVHYKDLDIFCSKDKRVTIVKAAAGGHVGKIFFDISDPLGGLASLKPFENNNLEVPVTTIDSEILNHCLNGPYLVKFDTHGYEIPIFEGMKKTIKGTEVIIIEVYNFKLTNDSLKFYEMCKYLENLGFSCIDLVEPMFRKKDDALWQMDLVFIKSDRTEFKDSTF
jgi:FkbM family methyltransferase